MARYDHTDPKMGTYRATLAVATDPLDLERLKGVGHDAQGRLVIGAGQTGVVAVWVATKVFRVGKRVDPMTTGQIVEFGPTAGDPGVDFGRPGTVYYSDTNGNIEAGVSEQQTITVTSGASPVTLSWNTAGPASVAAGAIGSTLTAADIQAALESLSNIEPGDVTVTGPTGGPFPVVFGGNLEGEDVPAITGTNATVATDTAGGTHSGFVRIGHTVDDGSRLIVRVIP